jgi:type III secretion protein R
VLNSPDPLLIVAVLALLGLVPFLAVLVTSYTKLVVVFGLLRLALGTQQTPPNMVLNALAIVLTCFVMAPVASTIYKNTTEKPLGKNFGQKFSDLPILFESAAEPAKTFLTKHTREQEKRLFVKTANEIWPKKYASNVAPDDFLILIPSFTLSELTQAFQIGFVIYLAFVVIDLVVAAILLAMGMSMVSPTTISVPLKLLLFVVLDGWSLLVQSLLLTYK